MKKNRSYTPVIILVLLGIALAVTTAWQQRLQAVKNASDARESPTAAPATAVRAEGRVVCYPGAQVIVGAEMTGLLLHVNAEENQPVEKGALMAELKSDELRASLAEAQARVSELEAELDLVQHDLERNRQLLDTHAISQQEFDRASRDLAVARARRLSAAATVARLEATLVKTRILAPIKGLVLRRYMQPGENIEATARFAMIADLSRVRVEAEVDEYDAGQIRVGQAVKITAEGFLGQSWPGTVEEVPSVVVDKGLQPHDPARPVDVRVLLVKIAFASPTPLKLGQRVEVEIADPMSKSSSLESKIP
jgi:HlyD family secretion protein